jgi:nicotinate-nucleotide pyrophosphorylase (carboxylating)
MRINIDEYLMNALKEDITQEDVSTFAAETLKNKEVSH